MADFEVNGKVYKNSFVTYENFYQNTKMLKSVKELFRSFSEGLRQHQILLLLPIWLRSNLASSRYEGYDSVFDYLLAEQR